MTLKEKMISIFMMISILMIGLNILNLRTTRDLTAQYDSIYRETSQNLNHLKELKAQLAVIYADLISLIWQKSALQKGKKNLSITREDTERLKSLILHWKNAFERAIPLDQRKKYSGKFTIWEEKFYQLSWEILNSKAEEKNWDGLSNHKKIKSLSTKILDFITDVSSLRQEDIRAKTSRLYSKENRSYRINFGVMLAMLIFSIFLGLVTAETIASPIISLEKAAEEVGRGNLDVSITVSNRDEIGRLGRSFNQMVKDLKGITISKSHLDRILQTILNAVFVLNRKGMIEIVNPATLDLLEYPERELVGREVEVILNSPPFLKGEIFQEAVHNLEISLLTKSLSNRPVLFSSSPMRDKEGNLEGVVCVAQDIRDQKRLEKEILSISDREQMRIAQDLHDSLGQHLGGLQRMVEFLLDQLQRENSPQVPLAEKIAGLIKEAVFQTRSLSHSLYSVELEDYGLREALVEFAFNLKTIFQVECELEYDETLYFPDSEVEVHLYRIAQEASHNAVKHGGAHRVTLRLKKEKKGVSLLIEDDGKGFNPEEITSSGMGIKTMKYRSRMIGGMLTLHSEEGKGTKVVCSIEGENHGK